MADPPPLEVSTSSTVTDLIRRFLPTYFGGPPNFKTSATATATSTICRFKSVLPSSHKAASVGDSTLFGGSSGDPPTSEQYQSVLPSLWSHDSIGGSIEGGPSSILGGSIGVSIGGSIGVGTSIDHSHIGASFGGSIPPIIGVTIQPTTGERPLPLDATRSSSTPVEAVVIGVSVPLAVVATPMIRHGRAVPSRFRNDNTADDDGSFTILRNIQATKAKRARTPFLHRSRTQSPLVTHSPTGYSFNPLASVPRKRLDYHAPPGSDSAFRSFDAEWMRIPKKIRVSSIIDINYPLPSMEFTHMEPYRLCGRDAPHRRAVFLIEQLHENASQRVFSQSSPKRLMTPGTSRVVGLQRGRMGMYLTNQSRSHLHYEEDSRRINYFIDLAKKQNIKAHIYPTRGEPRFCSNNGWNLFFVNGADWKDRIKRMHLSEVAHAILFPGGSQVPKVGKRGNRGKSLGWTGGQCLSKKNSPTAEPTLIEGTLAFAPLFVKMTSLIREMASHSGFESPFSDYTGLHLNRPKYAKTIHVENTIESLSVLTLIHDNDFTTTADWLREHFDRENCPYENWDWLGCVYEDIFVEKLGRWATIVITATSRKSISDSLQREVRIRGAADDMLGRYRQEKEATRFVIPSTRCSLTARFQEVDIHFEVGVHLSPLLFHVLSFQTLFRTKFSEQLPVTLILEFVYAFFCTNNTYRFHLEMEDFYKAVSAKGRTILNEGFVQRFLSNLIRKYGSLDGIESKQGLREGSVRFQACNGSMITDATIHQNLRDVFHVVKSLQGVRATLPIFKRAVRSIEKSMHGNGLLCSQKVVYALSFLGIVDRSFLKHCLPGSKQHFRRLKETQFAFETVDQVQQLVDAISLIGDEKGPILAPKAEEIVCKLLKPPGSQYKECMIRDVDLFSATTDQLGDVIISQLDYHTGISSVVHALPPLFQAFACSSYNPSWAVVGTEVIPSGLGVRLGSEKNKEYTVCEKSSSAARIRLQDESVVANEEEFSFTHVQTLLNKNRSVFLADPITLLVESFGLNRLCFCDSIQTRRLVDGHGWISTLNPAVFHNISLMHPFRQIYQVEIPRRSTFDIDVNTPTNVSYRSRDGSVMALLLHLLINVRVAHKNHWTKGFLTDTKEFVLLIPGDSEQNFAIAVSVVMRLKEKIVMRQFNESTLEVDQPICIGHFLESN
jgi:hypothetical protein